MNNSTDDVYSYYDYGEYAEYEETLKLTRRLRICLGGFILFAGLCGNILCIVVLRSGAFRRSVVGYLLVQLAVTDVLVLAVGLGEAWIHDIVPGLNIYNTSRAACKMLSYITQVLLQLSPWFVTLITLSRAVCVLWPLHCRAVCTKRRLQTTSLLIVVVILLMNSYILFVKDVIDLESQHYCNYRHFTDDTARRVFLLASEIAHVIIASVAPFILIFGSNLIIVRALIARESLQSSEESMSAEDSRSITVMLVVMSFLMLVLSCPQPVFQMLNGLQDTGDVTLGLTHSQVAMVATVLNLLLYVNSASNFIWYSLTGKTFRNELRVLCSPTHRPYLTGPRLSLSSSRTLSTSISLRGNQLIALKQVPVTNSLANSEKSLNNLKI